MELELSLRVKPPTYIVRERLEPLAVPERANNSWGRITEWGGNPASIHCDNGPETISGALANWTEQNSIEVHQIQPGKPQQNAYIERCDRPVRYDWPAQFLFASVAELRGFATDWLWSYNNERPSMALGGITPKIKTTMAACVPLLASPK